MYKLIYLCLWLKFISISSNIPENEFIIPVNFTIIGSACDIKFEIGTPFKLKSFEIDLMIPFNFISGTYINRRESSTHEIKEHKIIKYRTIQKLNYDLITDIISVGNDFILDSFPFYYTEEFTLNFNKLSLSYHCINSNNNMNLIHRLKSTNKIKSLAFGFDFLDKKNGLLYLGGLPYNVTRTFQYNISCPITKTKFNNIERAGWEFKINKINFGNITSDYKLNYDKGEYAVFQINTQKVIVSKNFQETLNDTIFNKMLSNEKCTIEKGTFYKFFLCECDVFENLPNLEVFFGGYGIVIESHDLIEKHMEKCKFLIEENQDKSNEWILGRVFMSKYKTEFDYDKNQVMFYSNNNIFLNESLIYDTQFNLNKRFFCILLFICCGVLLSIGFIYLILSICIRNKEIEDDS